MYDRYILPLVIVYLISGTIHNYIRIHLADHETLVVTATIIMIIIMLTLPAAIARSIIKRETSVSDWGFTLDKKVWWHFGLMLFFGGLLIYRHQGDLIRFSADPSLLIAIVGATIEEIIFRIYIIFFMVRLLSKVGRRVTWAVLLSALLFTVAHIPSKTGVELVNIMFSSIIMGFITYYTGSVLFPAFYHVASNTLPQIGILGGLTSLAVYFMIAVTGSKNHRRN